MYVVLLCPCLRYLRAAMYNFLLWTLHKSQRAQNVANKPLLSYAPPVPQWREPTWPATTEPLELNYFPTPFSSITASFTMPHILPRRRRPRLLCIAFTCFSLAALTVPAGAIWPFSPKRFTGNALVAAGSMGLDSDQRVVAFGDFNGDQLCVVLSVLASLPLHHILWMLRMRI